MGKSDSSYELQRCGDFCLTPEEQLLDCVRHNDTEDLERLVRENPNILETLYERDRNVLQKAIKVYKDLDVAVVRELIELGVNLHHKSPVEEHMDCLHFAARELNPRILEVICEHIKNDPTNDINTLCDGKNTALNLIIKRCNHDDPNFMECVRILTEIGGIDVNREDEANRTPIFIAANKKNKALVRYLLNRPNIDVDACKHQGKSARDLILTNKLVDERDDVHLPELINNNVAIESQCMQFLNSRQEKDFIETFMLDVKIDANHDDGYETFLQKACKEGLFVAARELLRRGAKVNQTGSCNKKAPIQIAGEKGHHVIFALLLSADGIVIPGDLLSALIVDEKHASGDNKCLEMFLASKHAIAVNRTNEEGYTPLHYAAINQNVDLVLRLLNGGANLGIKNNYGLMPIEWIDSETLRVFFDSRIVPIESKSRNNYEVTFDFNSLLPAQRQETDVESGNGKTYAFLADQGDSASGFHYETDVIAYLAKNKETRSLMNHPLITSFLLAKWHQFRWLFNINLLFYFVFCFSLYLHIYSNYIRMEPSNGFFIISTVVFYATFVALIARECFQLAVSPKKYLKDFENYLECLLIIAIVFMLSTDLQRNQVAAIAILLSAFEFIMLIGQRPELTNNIVMLRTVSWNFFKFFSWYVILIIAFAFSFFMLFNNRLESNEATDSPATTNGPDDDEDEEENSFVNPGGSLFKTIVMLTGEFDASSIDFDRSPIMSHIVFVLFVFLIAIILINLLNGLAVSDIQMIQSDAELYGLIARAQHVNYIDKMLCGDLLPKRFRRLCCFSYTHGHCNVLHWLRNKTMLRSKFNDGKFVVDLNGSYPIKMAMGNDLGIYLDRRSMNRTRSILHERQKEELAKEKEAANNKILKDILEELKIHRSMQENIMGKLEGKK